jgi:hypothetical protein
MGDVQGEAMTTPITDREEFINVVGNKRVASEVCRQIEECANELAEVVKTMRNENREYMRLNDLGDPMQQHTDRWATKTLARFEALRQGVV